MESNKFFKLVEETTILSRFSMIKLNWKKVRKVTLLLTGIWSKIPENNDDACRYIITCKNDEKMQLRIRLWFFFKKESLCPFLIKIRKQAKNCLSSLLFKPEKGTTLDV